MTARDAVVLFFAVAFAVSWTGALGVIAAAGFGFPAHGHDVGRGRMLVLPAMLAGPALAGVALTAILDGRRGLRDLLARQARVAVGRRWYATLLIAPAAMALVLGFFSLSSPGFRPALLAGPHAAAIVVAAVVGGLAVGFFEELGWTGFVTPRLLERRGVLAAGVILGLPWAAWHALPDYWGSAHEYGSLWLPHMAEWVLALTAFRVVMTWAYAHTRSLFLAQLLHASFTGGQLLLWPSRVSALDGLLWYGCFAVLVAAAAAAIFHNSSK